MTIDWAQFWTSLSSLADVTGIAAVGIALYGSIGILRYRRRLRKILSQRRNPQGKGTGVLSIGIGQDIEAPVRSFVEEHLEPGIAFENYTQSGLVSSERFYEVLGDLQRRKQLLADLQVKELHLFYAGPITLGMGIGAIFDNWIPVRVYGFSKVTGSYEYTFTLGKGVVLGLLGTSGDLPEQTDLSSNDSPG